VDNRQGSDRPWYVQHEHIVLLINWMCDNESIPRSEIARAVEKPWNYEDEYREALEANR